MHTPQSSGPKLCNVSIYVRFLSLLWLSVFTLGSQGQSQEAALANKTFRSREGEFYPSTTSYVSSMLVTKGGGSRFCYTHTADPHDDAS
jgi:hypothetical protein